MTRPAGYVELPGVLLKFRTSDDGLWLTATVWLDGKPLKEVARLHRSLAPDAKGKVYLGWVDVITAGFRDVLAETHGLTGIEMFKREPTYDGEER